MSPSTHNFNPLWSKLIFHKISNYQGLEAATRWTELMEHRHKTAESAVLFTLKMGKWGLTWTAVDQTACNRKHTSMTADCEPCLQHNINIHATKRISMNFVYVIFNFKRCCHLCIANNITKCSSFLLRRGGCSCSTESARTLSVVSTWDSTRSSGVNFWSPAALIWCKAASTSSLHEIWAASTTIWACNDYTVKTRCQKHSANSYISLWGQPTWYLSHQYM